MEALLETLNIVMGEYAKVTGDGDWVTVTVAEEPVADDDFLAWTFTATITVTATKRILMPTPRAGWDPEAAVTHVADELRPWRNTLIDTAVDAAARLRNG